VREVDVLKSPESASPSHLAIAVDRSGMEVIVRLSGRIDVDSSPDIRDCFLAILSGKQLVHTVTVDLGDVNHIEASGIATLVEALKIAGPRQIRIQLQGLHGSVLRLFEVTGLLPLFETIHGGKGGVMANVLESVGDKTIEHLDYVGSLNIQWWATLRAMLRSLPFIGNRYRWRAAVRQMLEIGVDAMPMVSLMSICTGFIFAMQGASELRRFGALRYVVDLVAVGFTRELGPLMTAIAVSGRSGSAFAAEIGTMKVTEEIDSLRVMALEPIEFVLAPKYLAALIAVPCLSVVANVCGILAGALFMFFSIRLTPVLYLHYVFEAIDLRDVVMGLIKSIVFGTIIAQVGCLEGFRVHGGPDSVGRSTTSAVVKSTFLVIVADAIFTAIFYFMGKH
jgi:phospholipid/cholesterol/gamma-HCH transport system permease protein